MKVKALGILIFCILLSTQSTMAQDDLMDMLGGTTEKSKEKVSSSFKATRLVSGHTIETRKKNVLEFIISHRFGTINSGVNEFWGLDDSQIRLALEYGISDRLNVGLGRSSEQKKMVDNFLKYKLLVQTTDNSMPISITGFTSIAIKTGDAAFTVKDRENPFSHRLYYTFQALIARKFNSNLSLQIMPTLVHRNIVATPQDHNDVLALGVGGRYKISKRVSINAEYYYQITDHNEMYSNALSFGVDIETGGHVFQVHLTNSRAMIEQGFITETTDTWADGGIHLGFNISRAFDLSPKKR